MFTKLLIALVFNIWIFGCFTYTASAITDPLSVPNNKFGIHLHNESDLDDAAKLVNSSGGDYGYVTVVIREDERDPKRWQQFFDKARKLHLIPIVRVASKMNDQGWQKLLIDEIPGWISFLSSLNWVTENRYVIVGNEPNHATEWGGAVNPEEYADYLVAFSHKLKSASQDFFILPAGLDASAPDNGSHISEKAFLTRMVSHNKDVFNNVDGWASHSYPNPDFSGSETATGKGTLHTYEWEKSLLVSLGVTQNFPIFITETGWAHDADGQTPKYFSEKEVTEKYVTAFQNNFNNPRIVAVTPFIINYTGQPYKVCSQIFKLHCDFG